MPPLTPGDRLGPYEILDTIGAGGMGQVYRARDTRLDRIVAIKVSSEQFSERFEHEARAIAQLNHPNVCQLYDVGPNYLVMEYVEGAPVAGPMAVGRAVALATQILDAITAAHARGILHRDLKPANILVTPGGIKLLDFGLAKRVSPTNATAQDHTIAPATIVGEIVGTLQYMSPEQLQGKAADERSDLFSFGCVLYEMLTGRRAFDGGNPASIIAAVLTRDAPSLQSVAPTVDRVVRRALAKEPEQRFQTARDLRAALLWAHEQPVTIIAPPHSRWRLAAAVTVFAGAAAAAGWFTAASQKPLVAAKPVRVELNTAAGGRLVFGANSGGIAVSPDGATIAYVASVDGVNNLWVRRLDEAAARPIPGTEAAGGPFWSPDGRSLVFAAGTMLKRIDLSGGSPIVLCAINGLRGGVWLPSGEIIFGSIGSGLHRVSVAGGKPQPVTELDVTRSEGFHGFPQLLDDSRFLYFTRSDKAEFTGIYVSSLNNPAQREFLLQTEANALVSGFADAQYLLWTRGGTLLAQRLELQPVRLTGEAQPIADNIGTTGITGGINVAASNDGLLLFSDTNAVSHLTWFDRGGRSLGTVGAPADFNTFDLSADGQRVIASIDRPGGSDLWLLDTTRIGLATRLTSRPATSVYPIWAPSGADFVFGAEPLLNVFRRAIAGNEQRLTRSTLTQLPLDWSPDGSTVLFYAVGGLTRGRDLLTVPANGGESTPRSYLSTAFNEWWAKFIPTIPTQWVAYQSDESGRWEVYVDSYPTAGRRRLISTGGGQFPQWAPGGRELFYVASDYTLMSVKITAKGEALDSSVPQPLFRLPAIDTGRNPYDVAPDGQRFLVRMVPPDAARTLDAIVNWPALLR